jgi:hypothetical protein
MNCSVVGDVNPTMAGIGVSEARLAAQLRGYLTALDSDFVYNPSRSGYCNLVLFLQAQLDRKYEQGSTYWRQQVRTPALANETENCKQDFGSRQ